MYQSKLTTKRKRSLNHAPKKSRWDEMPPSVTDEERKRYSEYFGKYSDTDEATNFLTDASSANVKSLFPIKQFCNMHDPTAVSAVASSSSTLGTAKLVGRQLPPKPIYYASRPTIGIGTFAEFLRAENRNRTSKRDTNRSSRQTKKRRHTNWDRTETINSSSITSSSPALGNCLHSPLLPIGRQLMQDWDEYDAQLQKTKSEFVDTKKKHEEFTSKHDDVHSSFEIKTGKLGCESLSSRGTLSSQPSVHTTTTTNIENRLQVLNNDETITKERTLDGSCCYSEIAETSDSVKGVAAEKGVVAQPVAIRPSSELTQKSCSSGKDYAFHTLEHSTDRGKNLLLSRVGISADPLLAAERKVDNDRKLSNIDCSLKTTDQDVLKARRDRVLERLNVIYASNNKRPEAVSGSACLTSSSSSSSSSSQTESAVGADSSLLHSCSTKEANILVRPLDDTSRLAAENTTTNELKQVTPPITTSASGQTSTFEPSLLSQVPLDEFKDYSRLHIRLQTKLNHMKSKMKRSEAKYQALRLANPNLASLADYLFGTL